jgi:hypothetical protein
MEGTQHVCDDDGVQASPEEKSLMECTGETASEVLSWAIAETLADMVSAAGWRLGMAQCTPCIVPSGSISAAPTEACTGALKPSVYPLVADRA